MEYQQGFIHEKLEIKILILYILNRLPDSVSFDSLTEIVMSNNGIGYFDYTESLDELAQTGHVTRDGSMYKTTEKGTRNGSITENSIPYSVRLRAERETAKLSRLMKRGEMIKTGCTPRTGGGYTLSLALSDGIGPILKMDLLCGSEEQALVLEKNFVSDAESLYNNIINLLSSSNQHTETT